MKRLLIVVCALVAVALAAAAVPATAQEGERPAGRLWEEFPLEPSATPTPTASPTESRPTVRRPVEDDGLPPTALIPLLAAAAGLGALTAYTAGRRRRRVGRVAAAWEESEAVQLEPALVPSLQGSQAPIELPQPAPPRREQPPAAPDPAFEAPAPRAVERFEPPAQPVADATPEPPVTTPAQPVADATPEPPVTTPAQPVADATPEPPVTTPAQPVTRATPEPPITTPAQPVAHATPEPPITTPAQPVAHATPEPPITTPAQPVAHATPEPPISTPAQPVADAPLPAQPATASERMREPARAPRPGAPRARRPSARAAGPDSEWETCRIKVQSRSVKSYFYAVAHEGGPVLARSPYFKVRGREDGPGIEPAEALRALVAELADAGWYQAGAGRAPWDLRFRRDVEAFTPRTR